ncbi:MAG: hypothetical protein JWO26_2361 [Rhodospirillales bacterium]|jgi:hypothetical protein|nr:hypothetical protein [Rhodospirillales bacterium]
MTRFILIVSLALITVPAVAQPRAFNCIGAERLEDDVFTIPFPPGQSVVAEGARSLLAAAAELALADPERNICVLGHAGAEGGAQTTTTLAAARAREVARMLAERRIDRERIRAEAHGANFSPAARADVPRTRSVSIVVLPATRERAPEPAARERAPAPAAREPAAREPVPRDPTAPDPADQPVSPERDPAREGGPEDRTREPRPEPAKP